MALAQPDPRQTSTPETPREVGRCRSNRPPPGTPANRGVTAPTPRTDRGVGGRSTTPPPLPPPPPPHPPPQPRPTPPPPPPPRRPPPAARDRRACSHPLPG